MSVTNDQIVELALSQDGDRYIFGVEVSPSDSDPNAFDCSELVQWVCARLHVIPSVPDGSWFQARHCKDHGTLVPVAEGIETRGALLFRFVGDPFGGVGRPSQAHVAISQGDGRTIEARSPRYGVYRGSAHGRNWTHAGRIPGVVYAVDDMVSPKDWDDDDKRAVGAAVWAGVLANGDPSYTIPDPGKGGQPVHPNTLLRSIRTDTVKTYTKVQAGLEIDDADEADLVNAIVDAIEGLGLTLEVTGELTRRIQ